MFKFFKRLFDIISSGIAFFVLLPVWIIAIIGILVSDPGPIFYVAKRVGKNGKPFRMYKFRSMRVDKTANERTLCPDPNRIYRWGQIIRDTKIDELPQLINVFIGDMSVIGPRPASVDQTEITRSGKFSVISRLKPGLSGPAALYDYIYGDGITNEDDYRKLVLPTRLKLDLYYIQAKSISFDSKMIWWTITAILVHSKRGAMLETLKTWALSVG